MADMTVTNGNLLLQTDPANPAASLCISRMDLGQSVPFAQIGMYGGGTNNLQGVLSFRTQNSGGTLEERLHIHTDGNVGIGTNAPAQKLEVSGTIKATAFQGDGLNLTNLNGSQITTGTIPDARVPLAIARTSEVNARFDPASGHKHTGTAGDGAQVDHGNLANVLGADTISTDAQKNKHVSNAQTKLWQDHVGVTAGNPHGTTATQVGALSTGGGTLSGGLVVTGAIHSGSYQVGPASVNAYSFEMGGPSPTQNSGQATFYLHHHGVVANQLRYNNGTLYLEGTRNGYGTTEAPNFVVGGAIESLATPTANMNSAGLILKDETTGKRWQVHSHGDVLRMWNGSAETIVGQQSSSIRFKENVTPLTGILHKIDQLEAVSFKYKPDIYDGKQSIGFIAEKIKEVIPEVVSMDKECLSPIAVDYGLLSTVALQGIKELHSKVAPLIEAVKDQQQQIEVLNNKLTRELDKGGDK